MLGGHGCRYFQVFHTKGAGVEGGRGGVVVVEFLIVEREFKNAHEFIINIKLKLISEKLGKNFLPN